MRFIEVKLIMMRFKKERIETPGDIYEIFLYFSV